MDIRYVPMHDIVRMGRKMGTGADGFPPSITDMEERKANTAQLLEEARKLKEELRLDKAKLVDARC